MKTLLQKAKEFPMSKKKNRRYIGKEEIDLSLAWIKDKISNTQISKVVEMACTGNQVYIFLAVSLREAYRKGKLIIK